MVGGLAHSGRVIFAAAAVMVAVSSRSPCPGRCRRRRWGSSSASRCCSTLLVRLMLVPILLRLTGRGAWWLPRWLDRLLPEVHFGH
jgi:RND superfamily putative drug exporter